MVSCIDSFLSSYVRNALIDQAQSEINEDCFDKDNSSSLCEESFVSEELVLKWEEVHKILGNFPDNFNILQQSLTWYKLMIKNVWKVINNVGKALMNSTAKQRNHLWKLCENLEGIVDLNECFNKLLSDTADSKLQVLLILTSSLERFLGNVYLIKGKNVPFLLRDLLLTEELLSIFGRIPIVFTQLLVGCPLGLNLRNVAWHGFLSSTEIAPNLVASLFILFASLNVMVKELQLDVPERSPVKLYLHGNLLKETFPNISSLGLDFNDILKTSFVIPDSQKGFWQEAFYNYVNGRNDECLIVLLPLLEHLLRIIYCFVNSCSDRLLTAEATDFYTTLDDILAPPTEDCDNHMIEFLGENLTEILVDILCYPEGPRIRDKISHGEFNLFDADNHYITEIFCNNICCVGLCIILVASQKLKLCTCNEVPLLKFKEDSERKLGQEEGKCKCDDCDTSVKKLDFLKSHLAMFKSKFHPVSYLLRSVYDELNKLMLWNQLPRPCEYPFETDTINEDVLQLKFVIINIIFRDGFMNSSEFDCILLSYLEGMNCSTLFRPRNEGIIVSLLRNIMNKVRKLNFLIKEISEIKYKQWNEHKMRSRARIVYQTMLKFLPNLQMVLFCVIFVILYETKVINQLNMNWQKSNRFLKYLLKFVENITSYCSVDKNQWQEVIKLTSDFTHRADDYLSNRHKDSVMQ